MIDADGEGLKPDVERSNVKRSIVERLIKRFKKKDVPRQKLEHKPFTPTELPQQDRSNEQPIGIDPAYVLKDIIPFENIAPFREHSPEQIHEISKLKSRVASILAEKNATSRPVSYRKSDGSLGELPLEMTYLKYDPDPGRPGNVPVFFIVFEKKTVEGLDPDSILMLQGSEYRAIPLLSSTFPYGKSKDFKDAYFPQLQPGGHKRIGNMLKEASPASFATFGDEWKASFNASLKRTYSGTDESTGSHGRNIMTWLKKTIRTGDPASYSNLINLNNPSTSLPPQ